MNTQVLKPRLFLTWLLVPVLCMTALVLQPVPAHAEGLIETGPFAGLGSLAAYLLCIELDPEEEDCAKIALLADPVGLGIKSTSMTLSYNSNTFTFDPQASGFLCQFSANGDCPAAGVSPGTFPVALLPKSGYSPGQPLPGSSAKLTDTGSAVTLDYQLVWTVDITQNTNFYLFMFDFKQPVIIDFANSTVTYSATDPGSDFTQTSFVCHTDSIPDMGCGSSDAITGVSLNLANAPEPSSLALLGSGILGIGGVVRKRLLIRS